MKLYIKQKVFSFKDRFFVKDEYGIDRYAVEGEFFSWGKKLHIFDISGKEVAFIQQKVWSFLPRYFVFADGVQIAEIVKRWSLLTPKYEIDGLGWVIEGDFFAHNYRIEKSGHPIVTIRKEWMTWGDSYELTIADPADEITALAVVLTIDCVMAAAAAAAASN